MPTGGSGLMLHFEFHAAGLLAGGQYQRGNLVLTGK